MNKKYSLFLIYFISFISLMMNSCNNPEKPEKGVSIELANERKEIIDSLRYQLFFRIPENKKDSIDARNTISFYLRKVPARLMLDFKSQAANIKSVYAQKEKINYLFQNEHIILPEQSLVEGYNEIKIDFIAGDMSLNRQDNFMYTLFVPDRARTAFPCFDQPDLKATFSLEIEIPKKWATVANGKPEDEEILDERKRIKFAETKKLPTYLFAFTAGKFNEIERSYNQRTVKLIHRETDTALINSNTDQIFEMVFKSLEWMEEYTGIPYPFAKYDLIAIPSFQYGGMEHTGATLYRAERLFLPPSPTQEQILSRANLIAHETAHMWFGDLVTMEWFNEVWLKEVFANFIAGKITRPWFPEIDHDLKFLMSHYPSSYEIDRTEGANPIQQSLNNLEDAGTVYGAIIYHKAPLVMNKLEEIIGEANIREGLQEYLKLYSYDNATWDNLIEILDKKTETDLKEWSRIWVEEPGMPHYNTRIVDGNFMINQADPENKGRIWRDDFKILFEDMESRVVINENTTSWQHRLNRPVFMNQDGTGYGYFEIADPVTYIDGIIKQYDQLLPVNRASQWMNLYENLLNYKFSPQLFLETLNRQMVKETNPLLRELMLDYQSTTYWKFLNPTRRKDQEGKIVPILWSVYDASEPKSKKAVFNQLVDLSFSQAKLSKLYELWQSSGNESLKLSDNELMNIAYELMLKLPHRYGEIMKIQESRMNNADRISEFRFIAAAIHPDSSVRRDFRLSLAEEENRERESWVITAVHYLNHPLRQDGESGQLGFYLDILPEIKETGDIFFPKRWLDAAFWGHSSEKAASVVKDYIHDNPGSQESLVLKIKQSSDLLFRAVKISEM